MINKELEWWTTGQDSPVQTSAAEAEDEGSEAGHDFPLPYSLTRTTRVLLLPS